MSESDVRILQLLNEAQTPDAYRTAAMPVACRLAGATGLAVVRAADGQWQVQADYGDAGAPPTELLAEALDQESVVTDGRWSAVPYSQRGGSAELLAFIFAATGAADISSAEKTRRIQTAAEMFGSGLQLIRRCWNSQKRIQRLEEILVIAAAWRNTHDMDQLLNLMAEASTRLLDAERASIFLWDRANKTLVGRPALGVENGELRIPDDTGVVGQVVQTGETLRVDERVGEQQIDRSVDQKLDFQTRDLLCCPLVGAGGERFGAFEMINKRTGSFTDSDEAALQELATHAAIALENTQELTQLVRLRDFMTDQAAEGVRLIGESAPIEALRSTIRRVADSELAVLVLGENGTGKEVVSRSIHYLSRRRNEPMVAVNCAALTETLLESELFGHEQGAFTDARETRIGKFELASGGTLFLDEIGDMSLGGQAKLLRVLEEKIVVRVGGSTPIHTDARVIAATNQNLVEKVRDKTFREDLYYRLNVVTLDLPPLRERGDDILLLADHFLRDFAAQAGRRKPQFTAAARKRLVSHSWPGNIRELRNLMERLAYLSSGDKIDVDELAFILSPSDQPKGYSLDLSLNEATRHFQIDYIRRQMERTRGNMTDAAQYLGLHRSNLYRKMRQLDMDESETKNP